MESRCSPLDELWFRSVPSIARGEDLLKLTFGCGIGLLSRDWEEAVLYRRMTLDSSGAAVVFQNLSGWEKAVKWTDEKAVENCG
jgi:hypothetical protein